MVNYLIYLFIFDFQGKTNQDVMAEYILQHRMKNSGLCNLKKLRINIVSYMQVNYLL